MKNLLRYSLYAVLGLGLFLGTSCSDDDDDDGNGNNNQSDPTLAAKISSDARFSTYADAIERTGLDLTLDGEGSFTVFAPTNEAFDLLFTELGVTSLDGLEAELGSDFFAAVLQYHVIGLQSRAANLSHGYEKSLGLNDNNNNLSLFIDTESASEMEINRRGNLVDKDIRCDNGFIHSIDQVLLPLSVYQLVEVNPKLSSMRSAIRLAAGNLDVVLGDPDNTFTLFAPTNAGFDTLVAATANVSNVAELAAEFGPTELARVIRYHAISSDVRAEDLSIGPVMSAATGSSGPLVFSVNITGDLITLSDLSPATSDAEVTGTNYTGVNGTVHIINNVMLFE